MPKPTDEKLYESVKKDLFKKYVKPSAYRSGSTTIQRRVCKKT